MNSQPMSSFILSLLLHIFRVTEYHVDGFRFDLASILCRGTDGTPLDVPPLIRVSYLRIQTCTYASILIMCFIDGG